MCGSAGEIRFSGSPADVAAVARITAVLADRGPGGSGVHAAGPIALGHRRLKIIDLSERGAQPMVDPELGLAAVWSSRSTGGVRGAWSTSSGCSRSRWPSATPES